MSLTQTLPEIIAECLLYPRIVVHVEGDDDIPFYETVLQDYDCHVIPRNGRKQCEALADALVQGDHPYVVVLDGDYELLETTGSIHSRSILLNRYSFENYLFETEPIEQFCRYRRPRTNLAVLAGRFREVVENVEQKFKELVVLDVAHRRSETSYKVLPNSPEQFFETRGKVGFRDAEIQKWCTEAAQHIDKQSIEDARTLVDEFLKDHRLIDLLPGHFAFGIIRRFIIKTVDRKIADDDIKVPLSTSVWDLVETPDHERLKAQLHDAVQEAQEIRRPGKGIRG